MPKQSSIKTIKGRGIPLPGNDIDTDQIIPARFLRSITFDDLGENLFHDARFNSNGSEKKHPLNDKRYRGASILIVNRNFGCGSSREHAPQSIMRYGIKAIIGESFAEIFADNCTAIGIPSVIAQKIDIENLMSVIKDDPALEIKIDLESNEVSYGDFSIPIKQKESARIVLTQGIWDSLSVLSQDPEKVKKTASKIPYLGNFK